MTGHAFTPASSDRVEEAKPIKASKAIQLVVLHSHDKGTLFRGRYFSDAVQLE